KTPLPLVRDQYTVGRSEENSVRLTERNVSRRHALLKKNGDAWIIEDRGSYNGSYVDGQRIVGERPLSHGEVIQLGDYRIHVHDEARAQVPSSIDSAPTVPITAASVTEVKPDRLVAIVGPDPGKEFPLNAERMTIGREGEAGIVITHSSISRTHAEVHALGGG